MYINVSSGWIDLENASEAGSDGVLDKELSS